MNLKQAEKLQASIPQFDGVDSDCNPCKVTPKTFIREVEGADRKIRATLFVSAEEGDGAADYYGEFRGGYCWINPALEEFAKQRGLHWEWQNPACIGLYD